MSTEEIKRKLTAIFSADVEGYSRLMGDNELATVQTLTEYKGTMRKLIMHYRGRVVDSTGDNLLAEFASVVDAVQCAVEVQQVLKGKNENLPENRRMLFRIGINLGDVIEEGDRIFGDGVNIAARIESLSEGGGVCISGSAYEQIENKLALGYQYMGEHAVKNIAKPIKVYKVPMEPGPAKRPKTKTWKKLVFAAALVLILGGGALAAWNFYLRPAPPQAEFSSERTPAPESAQKPARPPVPAELSIAVLPFANISGDPEEDYLSDGITEQIITALSKIPQVLVIARNSVFTYKGKPVMVQQVGEDLGVRYVLEGSVQKSGDRLRITAQLIDAKTGNHIWSERYDRELKDIFALQDDITKNVITSLGVKIIGGEGTLGKGTKNLEAYLKAIKGAHHWLRMNSDDNEIARQFCKEAIELDPNYAQAYVLLAWIHNWEAYFGWTKKPAASYEKAVELAKKAISLDEQCADAYEVLANVYAKRRQFEQAIAEVKKAISLMPASAAVNFQYGNVLKFAGRFKEAIPFLEKAIRLDPKHPWWYLSVLGWAYLRTGQNEKAVAAFNKLVSRNPQNDFLHASLGCPLIAAGKPEEAVEMFEKALNLNPRPPSWYIGDLAIARFGTGKSEEAITTMRKLVSRRPDDSDAYRGLSTVLTFQGKYEEAVSMAKKSISLKPQVEAIAYFYLGAPYLMIGEYEEAIAAYKRSISLWPEFMNGHVGLTASYSLAGRMEDAHAEVAEVLKINPKITLEDIAKNGYYCFQKADKERFIKALRKAGLK